MADRRACLLANHGMIAAGATLASALALAVEVEALAEMYWRALQLGEPALLSDAEMDTVIAKFRTYGQPRCSHSIAPRRMPCTEQRDNGYARRPPSIRTPPATPRVTFRPMRS